MTSSRCSSSYEAYLNAQTTGTVSDHKNGYFKVSLSILKAPESLTPQFLQNSINKYKSLSKRDFRFFLSESSGLL